MAESEKTAAATVESPHAQTLSRGIRALETLAEAPDGLSIVELATALGVHRSIAYRILRTLEDHGLVSRDAAGRVALGPRLAVLARSVFRDLQSATLPELTAVAGELSMTAFLVVLDQNECVTLVSVEPREVHATVAQRPGTRHALDYGAPGIAIQSRLTTAQWAAFGGDGPQRAEVGAAAQLGYATSHDEVIPGLRSVAAPLIVPGQTPAAIAVVYVASPHTNEQIGTRLIDAATTITRLLN